MLTPSNSPPLNKTQPPVCVVPDDMGNGAVSMYEQACARHLGMDHVVAVGYARHALVGVLASCGLEPGDEVILSPLTCKVVPLALLSLDLKPVYADLCEDTLNLDPRCVDAVFRRRTAAVLFQHTYGNSTGVEEIAEIASCRGIPLVEDCAQCFPYRDATHRPGSWGKAAIFSNNLRKPLPAGSGGLAVTNDVELARKLRAMRNQLCERGKIAEVLAHLEMRLHKIVLRPSLYWPLFEFQRRLGANYTVRPLSAEIAQQIDGTAYQASRSQQREGMIWLEKLEASAAHSRLCCTRYAESLRSEAEIEIPRGIRIQPLFYFPLIVEDKECLLRQARKKLTEVIAWPTKAPIFPLQRIRDMRQYGYEPGSCPAAEKIASKLVGLPTDMRIANREQDKTIGLLRKWRT